MYVVSISVELRVSGLKVYVRGGGLPIWSTIGKVKNEIWERVQQPRLVQGNSPGEQVVRRHDFVQTRKNFSFGCSGTPGDGHRHTTSMSALHDYG